MTEDENKERKVLGDSTNIGINLRWLIQIVVVSGMAVWGYFSVTSQITHLEIAIMRMEREQELNSEFRIKWPRGEMGSLPDDAEQNLRLNHVERRLEKMEDWVDELRIENAR